jgi:hypothetical protein
LSKFDRNKYRREWYQRNKSSVLRSVKAWQQSPNGREALRKKNAKYRKEHSEEMAAAIKRSNQKLRLEVLTYYSDGAPECACCGERELSFLTLDHTNGGGGKERTTNNHRGGTAQYRSLRKRGFPAGYRVLCWNCNCAIGRYGICPHKEGISAKRKRNPGVHLGRAIDVHRKQRGR